MASEKQSRKCPKCGTTQVRRSRTTLLDSLHLLCGYKAYRCRDCRRRFHLPQVATPRLKPEARTESRKRRQTAKRREFLVYALAVAVFVIAAFVITRERG